MALTNFVSNKLMPKLRFPTIYAFCDSKKNLLEQKINKFKDQMF